MSARRDIDKIYVVVVEDHQHVLEHIHSILRRRKELKPWSMLHFDAHPDLACPSDNVPALSCFLPRNEEEKDLYELLDSHSSGIAEWILPLVLAGGLERVHWIKPPQSHQLTIGRHEYHVGTWIPPSVSSPDHPTVTNFLDLPSSALVRVDWKHPYYLDDASVVSTDELLLAKKLQLTVSEFASKEILEDGTSPVYEDWALDICLDYFACRNPFLTDIEAIDPMFAEALAPVVSRTRLYSATQGDAILEPSNYKVELAHFRNLFLRLLQERDNALISELLQFYDSEEEARIILGQCVDSLSASPESATIATMAIEALTNLCMPHDSKSSKEDFAESVRLHVEYMSRKLQRVKEDSGDPFIVTIARSTLDGFTPSSIVEKLQDDVLTSVHDTFCRCDVLRFNGSNAIRPEIFSSQALGECRLKVIFDYGDWEGAMFE